MKLQHDDISRRSQTSDGANRAIKRLVPLVATISTLAACTIGVEPNPRPSMEVFDGGGIPSVDRGTPGTDAGTTSDGGTRTVDSDGGSCTPPLSLPCDLLTPVGSAPVSDFVGVPLKSGSAELTPSAVAAISAVLSSEHFALITAEDTGGGLMSSYTITTPSGLITQAEYLVASGQPTVADGSVVVASGAQLAYVTVFEPALTLSQTSVADAPTIIWEGEPRIVLPTSDSHIMAKTSAYGTVGLDQTLTDGNFTVKVVGFVDGQVSVEITDSCGTTATEMLSASSLSTISITRGTTLRLYVGTVNTDSAELAIVTDSIPLSDESPVTVGRNGSGVVSLSKKTVSGTDLASGDSLSVSGQSVEYTMSYDGVDVAVEDQISVTMDYITGSVTLPIQGSGEQTFSGNAISLSAAEGSIEISGVLSGSLVYLPGETRLFARLASGEYVEVASTEAGQFFATAGTATVVFTVEAGSSYILFQEQSGSGDSRFSEDGRFSYFIVAADGTSFQYSAAYDTGAITSNITPTLTAVGYTTPNCSTLVSFSAETVVFSVTDGVCHATFQIGVSVCSEVF